ncbi:MAG: hypothetical protein IKL57_07800 [Oscillospiraceae bacterium]|nr:hypothetical protein [Oscillospiraceae bacterium]
MVPFRRWLYSDLSYLELNILYHSKDWDRYKYYMSYRKSEEIDLSIDFYTYRDKYDEISEELIGFAASAGEIKGQAPTFINGIFGYKGIENSGVEIDSVKKALEKEPQKAGFSLNYTLNEKCLVSMDCQSLRIKDVKPLLDGYIPIVITDEQKKFLSKRIKNLDEILCRNNANELLMEIFYLYNSKGFPRNSIREDIMFWQEWFALTKYDKVANDMMLNSGRWTGERRSRFGRKLNRIYYEIFDQSRKG